MVCAQATGGYPPEIVNSKGQFDIDGMQMEVDAQGELSGKFRVQRPAGVLKPRGDWPENWTDCVHEFDGHGLNSLPKDRSGEEVLQAELMTLYVQNGIEGAYDDVSGAGLDPATVRAGRATEMGFFKDMGSMSAYHDPTRRRPEERSSARSGSTRVRVTSTGRRSGAVWSGRSSGPARTMLSLRALRPSKH